MKYLAYQIVVEVPDDFVRSSIDKAIEAVVGCDGTEEYCPMVVMSSTSVKVPAEAFAWLGL